MTSRGDSEEGLVLLERAAALAREAGRLDALMRVAGNRTYHADFDVVTMDGVGHFLFIEKPQEFNTDLETIVRSL